MTPYGDAVAPKALKAAVLGVPFDLNSSFLRGSAQAPPLIREMLHSPAGNMCTELGLDLAREINWKDQGDLDLSATAQALTAIEEAADKLLSQGWGVVALGGDHTVTLPLVRVQARRCPNLALVHLDAHPDLYDELAGNRLSHACPFARIMEEYPQIRLIQLGIRSMTPHQREQARRFGVEVVEMRDWSMSKPLPISGSVYFSLDLDGLDPAHAPGVSHPEPGGLTTRDVINLIQNLPGRLVGADIVEYNPECDVNGMTARVAAKLLKEVIGRMIGPLTLLPRG